VIAILVSGVLVGLPAGVGSYLALTPKKGRNRKASAFLLFYAAVLCAAFVLIVPDGKIIDADYDFNMPSAFMIGIVVGALGAGYERLTGQTD